MMSTPTTTDAFRATLTERKATVERELANLEHEMRQLGGDNEDERGSLGNHLADDGSNMQEQERILKVEGDLRAVLDQVNEAFVRLEDGTFGICQRCQKPIGAERLEYVPFVRYCIDCQGIVERENGGR